MKRNIFLLAMISFLFASCAGQSKYLVVDKKTSMLKEVTVEDGKVIKEEFISNYYTQPAVTATTNEMVVQQPQSQVIVVEKPVVVQQLVVYATPVVYPSYYGYGSSFFSAGFYGGYYGGHHGGHHGGYHGGHHGGGNNRGHFNFSGTAKGPHGGHVNFGGGWRR